MKRHIKLRLGIGNYSLKASQGKQYLSDFDEEKILEKPKSGLERFIEKYPDYKQMFIGSRK